MWNLHATGYKLLFSFPHRKYITKHFLVLLNFPKELPFPLFHTRNYCWPGKSIQNNCILNHNMRIPKCAKNWFDTDRIAKRTLIIPKPSKATFCFDKSRKKINNDYKEELGYLILWVSQKDKYSNTFFNDVKKLLNNLENHMKISRKKNTKSESKM